MNALILVGGYGTRLRPLTLTTPKPLISFCNRPILEHQIFNLARCGIREIILAIAYKPTHITNFVDDLEKKYNVKIIYSIEEEPLGTGGPIKLAEKYLSKYEDFFVFNSDIICSFPLLEMMSFHKKSSAPLTILVKEVEDPRAFGVVLTEDNRITKFEEKPQVPKSSLINAGIYILNREILNRIPLKNTSLEKEIFPQLANENMLYFYKLNKFWADIGKPQDFLKGQALYLEDLEETSQRAREGEGEITKEATTAKVMAARPMTEEYILRDHFLICYDITDKENGAKSGIKKNLFITFEDMNQLDQFAHSKSHLFDEILVHTKVEGNVLISSKTIIEKNCVLGDNVVLGENVTIGEGCRIKNSCVMSNSTVSSYSYIENSIIGSKSRVGSWSRIEGLCVLGENVILKPEIFVNNAFILPFKEVSSSIYEKGAIIM
ncbi:mannose-1-phosphate guanylyltransferase [Plasmodium inui San Antonio 1]|uniref:mannose-1-phosphate guanylyltransferase n=1 Tax=Plasmodium inui San Antonio 1 TaxID=1237626 RepID=W7AKR4_9APIC|nr:mannose-1-phosphate guanylyltransferase [Plasmodium inui San Antonio 1]EUD65921.1 mannose-1-phosphate guanylyltransferase [Plasmodium inui San Antonio 1]